MTFVRSLGRTAPAPSAPVLLAVVAAAALGACSHGVGGGKTVPDEFRVVAKAPLIVPPDYALRPPAPGEPRPQELQPESEARLALLGKQAAVTRSEGENLLVAKAGASRADPLIRYVIDDEYGSLAHKERSFSDRVMFWRKGQPQAVGATEAASNAKLSQAAPLDAAAEDAKMRALTGDKAVIIARAPAHERIKLPGL